MITYCKHLRRKMGVPFLPDNAEIVFREPFPKVCREPMKSFYIKAIVNGTRECEYRTRAKFKIEAIEKEISIYGKILNAKAIIKKGYIEFIEHSPQADFLEMVR